MKGIILAGGLGKRLYPLTKSISKHLLPIYNKPMLFYPLAILMKSNIRDILIITKEEDLRDFKNMLGNGIDIGINIQYIIQEKPNGIAESFLLGSEFIKKDNVILALGDNIFVGDNTVNLICESCRKVDEGKYSSTIFAYEVDNPKSYGVLSFDEVGNVESIEEKPINPKSNFCVTGLYIYDNKVIEYAKTLKPSKRNELEITDINNIYLRENKLHVEIVNRGDSWFDVGTFENLFKANVKIRDIVINERKSVACLEKIANNKGWIPRKY